MVSQTVWMAFIEVPLDHPLKIQVPASSLMEAIMESDKALRNLTYAYTVSQALGAETPPKYPIHVTVTVGGVDACGAVQPAGSDAKSDCDRASS